MAELTLPSDLAQRLQNIADRENLPVEILVVAMLMQYEQHIESDQGDPLQAIMGLFDDDISDLSTSVRETLDAYYQKKYGRSG